MATGDVAAMPFSTTLGNAYAFIHPELVTNFVRSLFPHATEQNTVARKLYKSAGVSSKQSISTQAKLSFAQEHLWHCKDKEDKRTSLVESHL